jgi:nitrogen fixation/metabolism regulation signal transduction histidine kinase
MVARLSGTPGLAELVLAQLPAGVGYFDAQGTLFAWNEELERILGSLPRQASMARFRPHGVADAPDTLAPIERALAGEPVCGLDLEVVQADGSGRWVKVTALPLGVATEPGKEAARESVKDASKEAGKDAAGKDASKEAGKDAPRPTGAVVLVLDVGEARSLDAVRDQVLAVVAHDLRNPLSALRMTATMLTKTSEMTAARRIELAERMLGTIGRMEALVATLVEHAQSERGMQLRLQRDRTDLDEIYGRVKRDIDVLFPGCALQVTRRGRLDGHWDAPRLARVLSNLITNALKHGASDHPVTLTLDGSSDDVVWFSVHNQGAPMDPELLPRAFDAFAVGTPLSEGRRRQLGLGLFIVEHLVTAHGGKVSAASSAEEGTTFIVTLPRR